MSSKLHKNISKAWGEERQRDATTLQLGITYAGMSLSRQAGGSLKIAAGDRAPDAPGVLGDGSAVRLFDLYRGPHWTLLRLFGEGEWGLEVPEGVRRVDVGRAGGVGDFVDDGGHVAEAYGGDGEYMLVRPDGYVGWIGMAEHLGDLKDYFGRVMGPGA